MATIVTTVVSSSNYPNNTNTNPASSSIGEFTGSMLGGVSPYVLYVSASLFFGNPSINYASASIGSLTGSMLGGSVIHTSIYTTVSSSTSTGSVAPVTPSTFVPTTYVMTGYYLVTHTRETWSGNSINTPPPSGNPLVDVTVVGMYNPLAPTNF